MNIFRAHSWAEAVGVSNGAKARLNAAARRISVPAWQFLMKSNVDRRRVGRLPGYRNRRRWSIRPNEGHFAPTFATALQLYARAGHKIQGRAPPEPVRRLPRSESVR